ncbi:MAG: ABC transporter substrate-binding protein [Chloroflexi bacterium]|nr:ABC transporter substrate-binding protein [Chloroflexota bacterium]
MRYWKTTMRIPFVLTLALALALLAAACGGGEEAAPTSAPAPTATARPAATATPAAPATSAPPAQGDKIVIGVDTFGDEHFISWNLNSPGKFLHEPLYDYMTYYSTETGLGPGLVDKWSVSSDNLKYTLQLRQDAQFSDGSEVTATDVKFLLDKMKDPTSKHPFVALWKDKLDQVQVDSKYQVTVTFTKLFATFPLEVSDFWQFPVMSKAYFDRVGESGYNDRPLGSGPYTFQSKVPGSIYRFQARDRHWKWGVPGFKELVLQKIPEAATRLAALRTGEVDVMPVSVELANQVAGIANVRVVEIPNNYATTIILSGQYAPDHAKFNASVPFLKQDVRRALNLAVNRQELIDTILNGRATPSVTTWIVPGLNSLGLQPRPYDPTQAKQILAQAGYPNGFETEAWSFPQQPENPRLLEATCGYWSAIGVKCSLRPTDFGSFFPNWSGYNSAGDIWAYSTAARPDYEAGLQTTFGYKQGAPRAFNKDVADLANVLSATADVAKRDEIVRQIVKIQYDNYQEVPVVMPSALLAVGPKVAADWKPIVRYNVSGFEALRPRR